MTGEFRMTGEFSGQNCCLILVFNLLVPLLDQYTDLSMATRLLRGPEDTLTIHSSESCSPYYKKIIFQYANKDKDRRLFSQFSV